MLTTCQRGVLFVQDVSLLCQNVSLKNQILRMSKKSIPSRAFYKNF